MRGRASQDNPPLPLQDSLAGGAMWMHGDGLGVGVGEASRVPPYTILNASLSVQRRMRLKLTGLVIPSPVGLAMVYEQNPSPP